MSELSLPKLVVVIPAAGVGSRMNADIPKQYLPLLGSTILEQTVSKFLALSYVHHVVIAISDTDPYFKTLSLQSHPKVIVVDGGMERADSVSNGVEWAKRNGYDWLMVHDAARPCVNLSDVERLFHQSVRTQSNCILGAPVKDTMKRTISTQRPNAQIDQTINRDGLWHAYTPQCCKVNDLSQALEQLTLPSGQLDRRVTDEASALELIGLETHIIESSTQNIKITVPEDLLLATFYLQSEQNEY